MTTALYHYTCDHCHDAITAEGVIRPTPQIVLGGVALAWFTDLDTPIRDALGLTSHTLSCDRTAHRFTVEKSTRITWWPEAARTLGLARFRRLLELANGVMPVHWYVATEPVPTLPGGEA